MEKSIDNRKKYIIIYSCVSLVITLLSLLFLFANIWEITVTLLVGSVFSLCSILVSFYFNSRPPKDGDKNSLRMYFLIAFRGLFTVLSVVVPALIIGFTTNSLVNESLLKYRILFCLISILPVILSIVFYYLGSKKING